MAVSDLDYSYEVACAEEMGGIHAYGVSTAIGVQTNMCIPALAKYGSDALREEWLAPTFAGDLVGCIGVSEVGSGSDVANVKSFARRDGDDYVINGQKMWISNGIQADWICMLVNTGEENGRIAISRYRRAAESAWHDPAQTIKTRSSFVRYGTDLLR